MNLQQVRCAYNVIAEIDLDQWHQQDSYSNARKWLIEQCELAYKKEYAPDDRIIFYHCQGDFYVKGQHIGLITRNLQVILDALMISNSFIIVVSTNPDIDHELNLISKKSLTGIALNSIQHEGNWQKIALDKSPITVEANYQYGSIDPLKMSLLEMTDREQFLLSQSKTFCMYPWIHLNANPSGLAYPCCMTDHQHPVGNCKTHSLAQIWNNDSMKQIRKGMLSEQELPGCSRCYEQEKSGFFSGRQSANKHHGHHINRVLETNDDGGLDKFEMIYWDIRFSNLCNLRCRSCGHIYSSQWYRDQAALAGPEWRAKYQVLNYAGRYETDMWEQLIEHIDHVEQIYFAGGEPLIMDEHYRILEELEARGKFDVRLVYNTNFTEVHLKDRLVFDYWKKFHSVSVGASLDAMGSRGEYIRKGTKWHKIEHNRQQMLEICPAVDFYVSSTLSILNAWHLPDFHQDWTQRGLIRAQDWNVNILLDPAHYRIDIAPMKYKQRLRVKFENHLEWLRGQDRLNRAVQGYESAVKFMMSTDNTRLLPVFWQKTTELDNLRKERLLEFVPELEALQ